MVVLAAERRLLGIVRNRAEQEFEKMYRRYAEEVFRYALLVLRSRPDAEDVTQATFVRAYRALQRGERVRKPHHWLIKIAHNECRRHLRSTSRRGIEVELDAALVPAQEAADDTPSVDEIREAMSHLSFNQRAALVMRELEDRSYAEIAEVLELSVSAVETLLFRARRAMREQLEGALACDEVEELLSRQLDGALPTEEQRRLRAHTRACADCATLERRQRGRRAALRRLGSIITLPSSLSSFVGGGGGAVAGAGAAIGIGAKAAAVIVAALTVTAVGSSEASRGTRPASAAEPTPATVAAPAPRHAAARPHETPRTDSVGQSHATVARVVVRPQADPVRARPSSRNHAVDVDEPTAAAPATAQRSTPAVAHTEPATSPPATKTTTAAAKPSPRETVEELTKPLPVKPPAVKAPEVPALPAPTLPPVPVAPGVIVPPVTVTVPPPPAIPPPPTLPPPPPVPPPPPPPPILP